MFSLARLPVDECEWNGDRVLSYMGKVVEVQVTGVVWDLNFHYGGRKTAEYDVSVGFIRRGDPNALGNLIRQFKPRRE